MYLYLYNSRCACKLHYIFHSLCTVIEIVFTQLVYTVPEGVPFANVSCQINGGFLVDDVTLSFVTRDGTANSSKLVS